MDKNKISLSEFEINQIIIEETKLVLQEKRANRLEEGVASALGVIAGLEALSKVGQAIKNSDKYQAGRQELMRKYARDKASVSLKTLKMAEDVLENGEFGDAARSIVQSLKAAPNVDNQMVKAVRLQLEVIHSAVIKSLREDMAQSRPQDYINFNSQISEYYRLLKGSKKLTPELYQESVEAFGAVMRTLLAGTDYEGKTYRQLVLSLETGGLGDKLLARSMSKQDNLVQTKATDVVISMPIGKQGEYTLNITRKTITYTVAFLALMGIDALSSVIYWVYTPNGKGTGGKVKVQTTPPTTTPESLAAPSEKPAQRMGSVSDQTEGF